MKLKPLHTTTTIEFYTPDFSTEARLPYVDAGLRAGFPSPADDFIELSIDINKEYIKIVTSKIANNDALFITNSFKYNIC